MWLSVVGTIISTITLQPLTSLCSDDSDVVPLIKLAVQLCCRGDKAAVRGNAEQRLRVSLGVYGVSEEDEY